MTLPSTNLLAMPDLSQWPIMLLVWCIAYYVIVVVHEAGHYLAGILIGIPAREMKIVLSKFPQHVALKDGEQWVSPVETSRYVQLAERFMPTTSKALTFVAGGFILETLFLLSWVMLRLPFHHVVISLALMMTLLYLITDVVMFLKTRQAGMDFSALYSISPFCGGALVALDPSF
jgi:hypothetical protein